MTEVKEKKTMEETKIEIKELIKALKGKECREDTGEMDRIRKEFKDVISRANPLVIAMAENELVKEGFSQDDLMSACDIHLLLFRDAIENPNLKVPEGHPIGRFQEEHRVILKLMEELRESVKRMKQKNSPADAEPEFSVMEKIMEKLMESENHNVRQENTLFPILEKHGIEQPPAIMWTEHTDMKEQKKEFIKILKNRNSMAFSELARVLGNLSTRLYEKFAAHTQKEQHILYVTALEVITEKEWKDIKEECDNLGYFNLETK